MAFLSSFVCTRNDADCDDGVVTGSMSLGQRQQALKTIADDEEVKVILVSMKAGGVGKHFNLLYPWSPS